MNADSKGANKLALLLVFLITSLTLYVQSAKGAAPTIPASAGVERVKQDMIQPKKPRDLDTLEMEVVGRKKMLLSKDRKRVDAVKFKLSKVVVSGVTICKKDELLQFYKPYLNKNISLYDLQDIANAITAYYRNNGYVLSRAIIPAQKIVSGKAHIQVIEGYVGAIYIEGDVSKVRSQIEKYGKKIKQMRPLQVKKLERYVLLLNDIPGLVVKTVLSPAVAAVGAADLTFVVEQKRISGNIHYDNRGSRYMGPNEIIASASVADVIRAADNLLLRTMFTPFNNELRYLQLGYGCPLGISGLRINLNGDFTETNPGFTLRDFDLVGYNKSWGIRLEYPLLRTRTKNFWLHGKFDWMDSHTDFIATPILRDHIRSVRFGVLYDFVDKWRGSNFINLEFSKGLSCLGASPLEPLTPLTRYHGRSNYNKINMGVSRYQSLGTRWMLVASTSGQYSFKNKLLSAEEFSFGGTQFGRAYDPSEIVGDSGVDGRLEMQVETYPGKRFLQQIQYYTFYEMGAVWNVGADFDQAYKDSAADSGVGLRANFNEHFYGNLEFAKPLTRKVDTQVIAGEGGRDWRFYFSLGVRL
jgi:hemolysin activation/secretion protein